MSSSIPQRHSPHFTPAPLPIPTRRPTHRANLSLSDSDDDSLDSHNSTNSNANAHVMTQHPYQDADEDPLRHATLSSHSPSSLTITHRALCHALNVANTAPSSAYHLTKTHDLAVLNRTSPVLPTHLLAIHDAPLAGPTVPLTVMPINIDTFTAISARTSPARGSTPTPPDARPVLSLPLSLPVTQT